MHEGRGDGRALRAFVRHQGIGSTRVCAFCFMLISAPCARIFSFRSTSSFEVAPRKTPASLRKNAPLLVLDDSMETGVPCGVPLPAAFTEVTRATLNAFTPPMVVSCSTV